MDSTRSRKWRSTARRIAAVACLHAAIGGLPAQTSSEAVRVHIVPAINRTGQAQFDAVATTVTKTASLTLRLLERYAISEGVPAGFSDELPLPEDGTARSQLLADMSRAIPAENIVFGEVVSGPPSGSSDDAALPELILSVYDRLQERVVLTERRRPETLFEIFTATDELTAALLTSFSGRRVAFGSLRITPVAEGDPGAPPAALPDYRVSIDGQPIGDNVRSVDSILTGDHVLTVTAEIAGERRTVYDREITVEEGSSTMIELPLPNIALLEVERRAAREAALDQATVEIARGQQLLRNGEWNDGVTSHRVVADLSRTFESTDLFGFDHEIGLISRNWAEYTVQQERKPRPWIALGLIGFGQYLASWYWDSGEVAVNPTTPLQQGAFTVPLAFGAGFLALWNALDWNKTVHRRESRRYGTTGEDPGISGWNPSRWEVSVGARAESLPNYWITDVAAYDQFGGLAGVRLVNTGLGSVLTGRYWLDEHHAFGIGVVPRMLDFGSNVEIATNFGDTNGAATPLSGIGTFLIDWTYTRTGRAFFRLGLEYTTSRSALVDLESDEESESVVSQDELLQVALYGSSGDTRISQFGLRIGSGFRFGRRPQLPWELGLFYRLEMIELGEGSIADRSLLYGHTGGVELVRAFRFGRPSSERSPLPESPTPFVSARARAEERWTALPITLRADGGGIGGIGPFLGAEWLITDHLAIGLVARLSIWMDYQDGGLAHMPNVFFPGIGGRYYRSSQREPGAPSGFYLGGTIEHHDYSRGAADLSVGGDNDDTTVSFSRIEGSLFVLMADGGYRLPLWRSSYLELGVQLGWAIGDGRRDTNIERAADGTVREESWQEGRIDSGLRVSPVLAVGTRLY